MTLAGFHQAILAGCGLLMRAVVWTLLGAWVVSTIHNIVMGVTHG